jgi:hypothetical protein
MAQNPIKTCKVCFKRFDSRVAWQVESHLHQGQGPTDSAKGER